MKIHSVAPQEVIAGADLMRRLGLDTAFETVELFGLELVSTTRERIADHLAARALLRQRTTVSFINAHCVNVLSGDRDYRRALEASDLLLPDGVGMDIAAGWHGQTLAGNLNGTDLFPELCARAAMMGIGLFLLGGGEGVAEAAGNWAQHRYPGLVVSGTHHGFFDEADSDAIIDAINASGARVLLVGMGVPAQETWIARHRSRLLIPVVLGVGGLFDYYSGRIPRAPAAVRRIRCEWLWRLAMEPHRMAERYLVGNAVFLVRAAAQALEQRGVWARVDGWAKRALDVAVAAAALIVLAPLLVATMLAIRVEDRGPALFRQTRIGNDGRPFTMFKFRSMFTDAERRKQALLLQSDRPGAAFKMRHDPRITRIGRIIRRLSIDELPQLINVLKGDMSLVGPRPALPSEVISYRGRTWDRLRGKPGITGTWQVRGRAEVPFRRQAIMDRAYLRRRTLAVDLKLLAQTLPAVASGRGAY